MTRLESHTTTLDWSALRTYPGGRYTKMDTDGELTFSHDSSFSRPMSACSREAFFESYSGPEDLSLFKSLALTANDTEPCSSSSYFEFPSRLYYIRDANITFNVDDMQFPKTNITTSTCCSVFIRAPPYTHLVIQASSVEEQVSPSTYGLVKMYHSHLQTTTG